jgi:hypothetical protein
MKILIYCISAILLIGKVAFADICPIESFKIANEKYKQEKYNDAILYFNKAISGGLATPYIYEAYAKLYALKKTGAIEPYGFYSSDIDLKKGEKINQLYFNEKKCSLEIKTDTDIKTLYIYETPQWCDELSFKIKISPLKNTLIIVPWSNRGGGHGIIAYDLNNKAHKKYFSEKYMVCPRMDFLWSIDNTHTIIPIEEGKADLLLMNSKTMQFFEFRVHELYQEYDYRNCVFGSYDDLSQASWINNQIVCLKYTVKKYSFDKVNYGNNCSNEVIKEKKIIVVLDIETGNHYILKIDNPHFN